MKKKLRILAVAVLAAIGLMATAGAASFTSCADKLADVGLFQGTGSGYALDRAPTRAEAATMLVRLLGKETEAQALTYSAPFTDLKDWQKPYVQYLYDNDLTTGVTETTFNPEGTCTAQMYTTFLLRALGYSDAAGDFTYTGALDYGETIGLVNDANCDTENFLRDHVAAMSLTALDTVTKDYDSRLINQLIADGAIDESKAASLLSFIENYDMYVDEYAATLGDSTNKFDMTVNASYSVTVGDEDAMEISVPLSIKADMDEANPDTSKMAVVGTAKMSSASDGESEMELEYYYTDGTMYINAAGQKMKMPLSISDAIEQLESMDMQTGDEPTPICMIESVTVSGNKVTATYSAEGLNDAIQNVLSMVNISGLSDDISMSFDTLDASVTLEDGKITGMKVVAKMSFTADGESVEMSMNCDYTVNAWDNITITLPTDLDTYQDISAQ
jgi:hypothetical protein